MWVNCQPNRQQVRKVLFEILADKRPFMSERIACIDQQGTSDVCTNKSGYKKGQEGHTCQPGRDVDQHANARHKASDQHSPALQR